MMNSPVKRITTTLTNGEVITVGGKGRITVYEDRLDGKRCEIVIVHMVIVTPDEPIPPSQNQPQDAEGGE